MWFVVALGVYMMVSGYSMHKELEGERLFSAQTMMFLRFWHNKASTYFLVVLLIQIITGLAMWAAPKLIQRRNNTATNR